MTNLKTLFILGFFFIFSVTFLVGGADDVPSKEIKITPELKKEFPIKHHHTKVALSCVLCHESATFV